jgi:hypothetical protein
MLTECLGRCGSGPRPDQATPFERRASSAQAARRARFPGAPQTQIPIEASRPCELYRVPAEPSMVDLEVGYLKRGEQLVACDAARQLAVQIHLIEHELEAQQQRQGGREGFRLWSRR